MPIKVAVLFEASGVVRDAFHRNGQVAVSCDLNPSESNLAPHLQGDVFEFSWSWADLIIAHPPCTYLAVSGNRYYAGTEKRQQAADLIWRLWNLYPDTPMVIENPVGQLNTYYPQMPRPQYIQPWQFGHGETKKTGLWKRGVPDLVPTNIVKGREQKVWKMGPSPTRAFDRARTYPGIANAMAEQWSAYLLQKKREQNG